MRTLFPELIRLESAINECFPKCRKIRATNPRPSESVLKTAKNAEAVLFFQLSEKKDKRKNRKTIQYKCQNILYKQQNCDFRCRKNATTFDGRYNRKICKSDLKYRLNYLLRQAAQARSKKLIRLSKNRKCTKPQTPVFSAFSEQFAAYNFRFRMA